MSNSSHASEREARSLADRVLSWRPGRAPAPARVNAAGGRGGAEAPPIVHQALAKGGQPLDGATRTSMESGFGQDLGRVRIHTDALAADSASAIKARAYTVGQSIAFNSGEYAPRAPAGRWLLAHELAHTLQHQAGAEPVLQRFEGYEHIALGDEAKGDGGKRIFLSCHELDFPAKERKKPFAEWPKLWRDRYIGYTRDQRLALQLGLTYGEIVALVGDLYASFADLDKAGLREVLELIPLIRSDKTTTAEFQEATGGRYLDLAEKNIAHFLNVPKGNNIETWREGHRAAINLARQGNANAAWGTNAGADHFLTDAFSSGHLRAPRAEWSGTLSKNTKTKVFHDLENEFGVEVKNSLGEKWIAYGDKRLNDDPPNKEGRAQALKAVELSKKDIANALAQGMRYPDGSTTKRFAAEDLVPQPVDWASYRWNATDEIKVTAELFAKEGPYGVAQKLYKSDDEAAAWVTKTDQAVLSRMPVAEKIRMLKDLVSGTISIADVRAIEKILGGVPDAAEMTVIRWNFWDPGYFDLCWDMLWVERIERALDRFSPKKVYIGKKDPANGPWPGMEWPPSAEKPSWKPEKPFWPSAKQRE